MIRTSLSAVLCLALVGCIPESSVQSASTTRNASDPAPDNTTNLAGRLLAKHNEGRDGRRLPRLTWSPTLAAAAAPWARTVAGDGKLRHSSKESRPGQGENIWMGTAQFYSLEHMMDRFLDEERMFRPGVFPEVTTTRKWEDVAHYTQIIWPETREVGCALATVNGRDALVCRYSPPGNIFGQPVG